MKQTIETYSYICMCITAEQRFRPVKPRKRLYLSLFCFFLRKCNIPIRVHSLLHKVDFHFAFPLQWLQSFRLLHLRCNSEDFNDFRSCHQNASQGQGNRKTFISTARGNSTAQMPNKVFSLYSAQLLLLLLCLRFSIFICNHKFQHGITYTHTHAHAHRHKYQSIKLK